jgi:hypothetical protein
MLTNNHGPSVRLARRSLGGALHNYLKQDMHALYVDVGTPAEYSGTGRK